MGDIYIINHTKKQHLVTKNGLTPKLLQYIKDNWKRNDIRYKTNQLPPKGYSGGGYYVDGMLCYETFSLPLFKKKRK